MSTPVPPRTRPYNGLPPVSLDLRALLDFNRSISAQLNDFEERFYRQREHPIVTPAGPAAGRMAPRKPK
ncbi:MAG: hypothetical protein KDA44_03290 [Planctomycetales bacterium]|nr:hypothetical protein [Planctomycetales bacterium]